MTTHERTKRSRFSHLGFLGLNFMNLLKRTWETGAIPLFENRQHLSSYRLWFFGVVGDGENSHGRTGVSRVAVEGGISL